MVDTHYPATRTRPVPGGPVYGALRVDDGGDYVTVYHGTTAEGWRSIQRNGVDLTVGNGEFGRGFYTSSSPAAVRDWVRFSRGSTTTESNIVILEIMIPRSRLAEIYGRGSTIDFPLETATATTGYTRNAFDNLVSANRRIRNAGQVTDVLDSVEIISGPSVSRHGNAFDQFKFSNSERNRSLFAPGSTNVRIRPVTID